MVAIEAAVCPCEPGRLLAIFRLGGYEQFTLRFGDSAINTTACDIAQQLPVGIGPSCFYYRPRADELCVFVEGSLAWVERAFGVAAAQVNAELGSNGIAVGYGTTIVPFGTATLADALVLVDSRVVDADGRPLRRSYRSDFMTLRGNAPLEQNREDWSLRIRDPGVDERPGLAPSRAA